MSHWTIIHNPRSASGKSARVWPQIATMLQETGLQYTLHTTTHAGHATQLARQAIAAGARQLLAVGGDGTVNEVLNGIFGQTEVPSEEILFSQIPIGTGNDWRRTIGIPKRYADCVLMLQNPGERRQDVGVVDWEENAQPHRHYFANVAGMGFEALVGLKANIQKAAGKGGPLGYYAALVSSLVNYKPVQAAFVIDGKPIPQRKFFTFALGICRYNGGGMMQCPAAVVDDGYFDLTLINDAPKMVVIANVPRLFNGSFVKIKYVEQHRAKTIQVIAAPDTLIEVDGENIGQGAATFSILPRALRVAVPQ